MKKQIIIGTTTVCGEGMWTAEYADTDEGKSIPVIGNTIPEAIGVLTVHTFEIVYTDAAKEKLERIQQAVACMDAGLDSECPIAPVLDAEKKLKALLVLDGE